MSCIHFNCTVTVPVTKRMNFLLRQITIIGPVIHVKTHQIYGVIFVSNLLNHLVSNETYTIFSVNKKKKNSECKIYQPS